MSNLIKALIVAIIAAFIVLACGAFVFWTVDFGTISIVQRFLIVWVSFVCAALTFIKLKDLN